MAARKTKGTKDKPWPQVTRDRIQGSMLVKRLEKHALGECEMDATQVRAAEILLKKTLPDLSAVELKGEVETRTISDKPHGGPYQKSSSR